MALATIETAETRPSIVRADELAVPRIRSYGEVWGSIAIGEDDWEFVQGCVGKTLTELNQALRERRAYRKMWEKVAIEEDDWEFVQGCKGLPIEGLIVGLNQRKAYKKMWREVEIRDEEDWRFVESCRGISPTLLARDLSKERRKRKESFDKNVKFNPASLQLIRIGAGYTLIGRKDTVGHLVEPYTPDGITLAGSSTESREPKLGGGWSIYYEHNPEVAARINRLKEEISAVEKGSNNGHQPKEEVLADPPSSSSEVALELVNIVPITYVDQLRDSAFRRALVSLSGPLKNMFSRVLRRLF